MINYDKTVLKYDNAAIILKPTTDYTGWELKYLVKKDPADGDIDAILSITPQLVTVDNIVKILIPFLADTLDGISAGAYYHSCKVIKEGNAKTLFNGLLIVEDSIIKYPMGA